MKKNLRYTLDLQLFASEGAEGVNGETGAENAAAGQNGAVEVTAENEFAELINGKFKEQFTKKTQAIIDKRFKQTKELEDYKQRVSPAVQRLMEKYGFSPGEEDKLSSALEAEQKNAVREEQKRTGFNHRKLAEKVSGWVKQGEELKENFPDFDIRRELGENKVFGKLLMCGVPVKTAYEAIHKDEILSGAMAYTAGKVREQVVKGIEAKGRRPVENGVSSESAVVTSVDVNSLTSQDILKILKQVENGANVRF